MATLEEIISIELGDIIEIIAPTNPILNNKMFLVNYIDNNKLKLINTQNIENIELNLENGIILDKTIISIALIDRSDKIGYSRQNKLLPKQWINIYFNTDPPLVVTGEIVDLEQDMITVKSYPDNEIYYINFAYKGIPQDLLIEKIILREKPSIKPESTLQQLEPIKEESDDLAISGEEYMTEQEQEQKQKSTKPDVTLPQQLEGIIFDADQIVFGTKLGSITQIIEVSEDKKRFGIENQINDLLDELLTSIPSTQRTPAKLTEINIMLNRFKQLREKFSNFDDNYNALLPTIKGPNYKPLVNRLINLDQKLYWILFVAQNKKKLYDIGEEDLTIEDSDYILNLTLAESLIAINDILEQYKTNQSESDNKYSQLMNRLNPYLTPFGTVDEKDNLLASKEVQANLLVIMNNLDNLESTAISDQIPQKIKFLFETYNIGLTQLNASEVNSNRIKANRVKLTNADTLEINSVLTLPEPIVRFSHINLPSTSLLDKSSLNLNFIQYWNILNKNTHVNTTIINNIEQEYEYKSDEFLNNVTHYICSEDIEDPEKYEKFINTIVPKTKNIFKMIQKYIHNKLSLYEIIKILEPFMIYQDDISYHQYVEISGFIAEKVFEYKKTVATINKENNKLLFFKYREKIVSPILTKILQPEDTLNNLVLEIYNLLPQNIYFNNNQNVQIPLSNSEIICKLNKLDYMKIFQTAIAKINLTLITLRGMDDSLEDADVLLKEEIIQGQENDNCNNYVLAKKYKNMEDLTEDNGKDIFFDTIYDPTHYEILQEYNKEFETLPPEQFLEFLQTQLQKNIGLASNFAKQEAEAMIMKKRKIADNDFGLVELIENPDNEQAQLKHLYYKRIDNQWIYDDTVNDTLFRNKNKLFCNLQPNCLSVPNNCTELNNINKTVQEKMIRNMLDEFDSKYKLSRKEFNEFINNLLTYLLNNINAIKSLDYLNNFKYNNEYFNIGLTSEHDVQTQSPQLQLRDRILGESDIIKKYNNLFIFVNKYTREAIIEDDENEWWLYCPITNTKLVPTFLSILAHEFMEHISSGDFSTYQYKIESLCKKIGAISDDGNAWVDKNSGYVIKEIEFDNEEGYEESGYKMQSRELLEKDLGTTVLSTSKQKEDKENEFIDPNSKMISNIIDAIAAFIGINLSTNKEFIIRNTLLTLPTTIPNEDVYKQQSEALHSKKGKHLPPYDTVKHTSLLLLTLCFILIAIQTSIPSIKTRKTFPGCIKSFHGYPLDGQDDNSAILYIACVANKVKSSTQPWDTLKKSNEINIVKRMKDIIEKFIINKIEIKTLYKEKIEYLLISENDNIPIEHDINTWINFLPPLKTPNIKNLHNITTAFQDELKSDLKTGSNMQQDKINTIKAKIIYYSFSIQDAIQTILDGKSPILENANQEPFLANNCCNENPDQESTIQYFNSMDNNILQYNEIVINLNNILLDINSFIKAPILFSDENTRLIYPTLSSKFNDNTVYLAFINYCNYNNDLPISQNIQAICMEKVEGFNNTVSLEQKINFLKEHGRNYTDETLVDLLQIIARKNIINLSLVNENISSIQQLRTIIDNIKLIANNKVNSDLQLLLENLLDTYLVSQPEEATQETNTRDLRNFLSEQINNLTDNLQRFITENIVLKRAKVKLINTFLTTDMDWKVNESNITMNVEDEAVCKNILFYKNHFKNILTVIPNIILNKINYTEIVIPKHWKLSQMHNNDIKKIIKGYYEKLTQFYDNKKLEPILLKIQSVSKYLLLIIEKINPMPNINMGDTQVLGIFDNITIKLLFKYFLLQIFNLYIELANESEIILTPVQSITDRGSAGITADMGSSELDEAFGSISEVAIISGNQRAVKETTAALLVQYLFMIIEEKKHLNYNEQSVSERILRSKENEKEEITTFLRDLTDEQREIENLFKNNKLERWSKGLQKGLTQYVQETYDEERTALEKKMQLEADLSNDASYKNLVTEMNKDIYMNEKENEMDMEQQVAQEESYLNNAIDADDGDDRDMEGELD